MKLTAWVVRVAHRFWVKIGEDRYCVGIHTNGDSGGNSATRIVKEVFDNIKGWKAEGA